MRSLSDTFDQLRDVIQRPQRLGTKVLLAGGVQFCPQLVQIGQVGLDLFGRGQAMLTQEVGQQVLDWGCQLKCGGGVGNRLDDAKSQQLLDDMCRGGALSVVVAAIRPRRSASLNPSRRWKRSCNNG